MKTILETPRIILREFERSDAGNLYLLNSDPDVIRYTGDAAFGSVEAAENFLKEYSDYRKHGCGRWAMVDKNNGDFLGWCGLKFTPAKNETDIGFRLFKKYWGKGYATEAAKACIDYGFGKLDLEKIIGRAMTANTASIRVLEKIGLIYEKPLDFDGQEGVGYKIEKRYK